MNLFKGLLIAAGVGLLWKGSQATKFLDQLTWTFRNVHLDFNKSLMTGFSKIYLTLNVSFSNTTNFTIGISRIVCDVAYNGYPVGSIDNNIPFEVQPQTTNDLSLPLVVRVTDAADIMTELINHLQNMTQTISFNFKGHIETGVGSFSFDETKALS